MANPPVDWNESQGTEKQGGSGNKGEFPGVIPAIIFAALVIALPITAGSCGHSEGVERERARAWNRGVGHYRMNRKTGEPEFIYSRYIEE
jgi:hypothetical protein